MRLKDAGDGITNTSIQYFRENRYRMAAVVEAEMVDHKTKKWPFRLKDGFGNEIRLSGCRSGDRGAAAGGTHDLLRDIGFDVSWEFVRDNSTFVLKKNSKY